MTLPFTAEQFLEVFKDYNLDIWPMQVVAYILGILVVALVFSSNYYKDRVISMILSLFWLWTGTAYHLLSFSKINKMAYVFGALFLLQGVMFLVYGTVKNKINFGVQNKLGVILGGLFIIYAMIIYPLIGYFSGHGYPYSPLIGVAPCPTTILTFGLFLLVIEELPLKIIWIPLFWSLLGISASLNLGIREDIGMVAAGLICAGLTVIERYKCKREGAGTFIAEK